MKKIYLIFIFFGLIKIFSQKQLTEKQIDSLQNTIYTTNAKNAAKIEHVCTELYNQSKKIGYKKGQVEALLRKTAFRINSKNYENVQQYLDECVTLANEMRDYFYLTKAKAMEASMLMHLQLNNEGKRTLDENIKLIPKIKDKNKRLFMETYYYARYIQLYSDYNDSILYYSKKRLKAALSLPESDIEKPRIIVSTAGYLTHYYNGENVQKAEYYLDVQKKYLSKTDNLFDLINYHKRKADFIYDHHKNEKGYLDSALFHFKKAEHYAKIYNDPEFLELIYPEIAHIYADKKEMEKEASYLKKHINITDSIIKNDNKTINDIIDKKNTEQSVDNDKKQLDQNLWTYFIFSLILIVLILFILHNLNKKKQKIIVPKGVLYNNVLNEDMRLKKLALENNIAFFSSFLEVYPNFGKNLLKINSTFTHSEIEFCALLKLGLNSLQISSAKKMTIRAIDSKKYRIRKKLSIPSDENLHAWMSKI